MNAVAPITETVSSSLSRPVLTAAVIGGALIAATLILWAHFGSAVFYEMLLTGLSACW
jgi:hypothetical protein